MTSTTKTIDDTDIICGLKAAITELECHQQAQILKKQVEKPGLPSLHITIPIHIKDKKEKPTRQKIKPKSDKRISSKSTKDPVQSQCKDKEKSDRPKKTPDLIFPEMRAGMLYEKCLCLHRNGLQDECPLIQCQGKPECMVEPWPICPPGKHVRSLYPQLYPTKSKKDCT